MRVRLGDQGPVLRFGLMRVFLFGAGVSAGAGFPLGASLTRELGVFLDRYRAHGGPYGPILEAWDALQRTGVLSLEDDLELNLSRLDVDWLRLLARKRRGETIDPSDPVTLRGAMTKVVGDYFKQIHGRIARNPGSREYLRQFLERHVRAGDVILTFNYDCLAELILKEQGRWNLRDGYGVDLGSFYPDLSGLGNSDVVVLKLHGSLGWMDAWDKATPGFRQGWPGSKHELLIQRVVLDLLGYPSIEAVDAAIRRLVFEPLVLPSYLKEVTNYPLAQLWRRAAQALAAAEAVNVVGYSFPSADGAARTLMLGIQPGGSVNYYHRGTGTRLREIRHFFGSIGVGFRDAIAPVEELAGLTSLPL